MDAPTSTVVHAVKSIGSRLFGSHAGQDQLAAERSRHAGVIETVRAFLDRHVIEPTPDNYALAYRSQVAGEPGLEEAVAAMIASGYAPADAGAGAEKPAEDDLTSITERAQENLKAVEHLVRRSADDTKGFSSALQSQIAATPEIDALIDLTRNMIERTKAAEKELRARGRAMTDLQMSLSEARIKADTDALTGLNNRRAFERHLGAAGARAMMTGRPLTLAICDLDKFKAINDEHGHCAGDRVLQFVSRLLKDNCGPKAQVSRFGGEEFVVVFEETGVEQAYEIIDAIRRDLHSRSLINRESGEPLGEISFSAGIALLGRDGEIGRLLRAADRALYQAKDMGRDCVVIAPAA